MNTGPWSLVRSIAAWGALAAAGCAVVQIDVDVYKGPLANHEQVQVEQVHAMAMGAKPLLIELRDRLEMSDRRYEKQERGVEDRLDKWRQGCLKLPGDNPAFQALADREGMRYYKDDFIEPWSSTAPGRSEPV